MLEFISRAIVDIHIGKAGYINVAVTKFTMQV